MASILNNYKRIFGLDRKTVLDDADVIPIDNSSDSVSKKVTFLDFFTQIKNKLHIGNLSSGNYIEGSSVGEDLTLLDSKIKLNDTKIINNQDQIAAIKEDIEGINASISAASEIDIAGINEAIANLNEEIININDDIDIINDNLNITPSEQQGDEEVNISTLSEDIDNIKDNIAIINSQLMDTTFNILSATVEDQNLILAANDQGFSLATQPVNQNLILLPDENDDIEQQLDEMEANLNRTINTKQNIIQTGNITISTNWTEFDEDNQIYSQVVSIPNLTNKSKIDLQLDMNTIIQLLSDEVSALWASNNNKIITIYALGGCPSVQITVQYSKTQIETT